MHLTSFILLCEAESPIVLGHGTQLCPANLCSVSTVPGKVLACASKHFPRQFLGIFWELTQWTACKWLSRFEE